MHHFSHLCRLAYTWMRLCRHANITHIPNFLGVSHLSANVWYSVKEHTDHYLCFGISALCTQPCFSKRSHLHILTSMQMNWHGWGDTKHGNVTQRKNLGGVEKKFSQKKLAAFKKFWRPWAPTWKSFFSTELAIICVSGITCVCHCTDVKPRRTSLLEWSHHTLVCHILSFQ